MGAVAQRSHTASAPLAALVAMPAQPPTCWGAPASRAACRLSPGAAASAPTYLLQLGAPRELLHRQGKAVGELQLARPDPLPKQHLPVGGHTQHLEAVAVPRIRKPNHLGQRHGQGERAAAPRPSPTSQQGQVAPSTPTFLFSSRGKNKKIPGEAPGPPHPPGSRPRGFQGSSPSLSRKPGQLGSPHCWGQGCDSGPGCSGNAEGSCLTANSLVTFFHSCAKWAPSLLLCLKLGPGGQGPAQRRGWCLPDCPAAPAPTWFTGSVCVSSVRPVRQSSGSSGWLRSHTSTSPLYSPPVGPSGPGQKLIHTQQPGFPARSRPSCSPSQDMEPLAQNHSEEKSYLQAHTLSAVPHPGNLPHGQPAPP